MCGSDSNVLEDYLRCFCFYVAFLWCEYWASFSIFSLCLLKKSMDIHLSLPWAYPGKRENRCFKSVSSHISVVLGFFYTSFDSYLGY